MDVIRPFIMHMLLCVLLFLSFEDSCSADIYPEEFAPCVRNFDPETYNASNINWSIVQNNQGRIFLANNTGLLVFNGKSWEKIYPFGSDRQKRIRSLCSDEERVYIGAYREFGYLEFQADGKPIYTSLSEKIADQIGKEDDIWYIKRYADNVFFIYFNRCYIYNIISGDVRRINVSSSRFFEQEGTLCLSSQTGNFYKYDVESETFSAPLASPLGAYVQNVIEVGEDRYYVTADSGILKQSPDGTNVRVDSFKHNWPMVNCCLICKDSTIICGTIGDGVMAFDMEGNFKWHVDKAAGLQNNDVMALMEDVDGNIWVALDRGVSVIYKDGPGLIPVPEDVVGKVTSVFMTSDKHILIGSNNGLYKMIPDNSPRVEFLGLKQKVWSISEIDGNLFIGGNSGTMIYDNFGKFTKISDVGGGTDILRLRNGDLVQATFAPIYSFKRNSSSWEQEIYIKNFYVPALNLLEDHLGNLWVEHIDQGLYHVSGRKQTDEIRFYRSLEGDSTPEKIHVNEFQGRILFSNDKQFYVYDDINDKIIPYRKLNDCVVGYPDIHNVVTASDGTLWVEFADGRVVSVETEGSELKLVEILDCNGLSLRFHEECKDIVHLGGTRYLLPVDGGMLIFDKSIPFVSDVSGRIGVSSVVSTQEGKQHPDTGIYHDLDERHAVLANGSSVDVSIYFSGCKYVNSVNAVYTLDGYEKDLHVCTDEMKASYTHLPRGHYVLRIYLKDNMSNVIDADYFDITVRPSIWASWVAIIIYAVIFLIAVFAGYVFVRYLLKKQKIRLEEIKNKEMMELRNRQLEDSLLLKSEDLAKYSLIEAQRNNILDKLRDKITQMRIASSDMKKSDYWELMQIIDEGGMSSDAWGTFYNNFDMVHDSFFVNLSTRYPSLSQTDLRYCAYLRLNMSTKEIAKATGVTVKGVEAAKGRLRKKMSIPYDVPIGTFILNFAKNETP